MFIQNHGMTKMFSIKTHNKSVMFARKNTRAGTGLRAAPARPIHWRYVPRLSMRVFLTFFGLFISSYAYSNAALDAENEGEAIGIVYGHIKEIDVLKFMCNRKVPETGSIISDAVDAWMVRNSVVVTNLMSGLDRVPEKEREQLFELGKKVSNNTIVLFNKQSQSEKEKSCLVLANKLDSDFYKEEYPVAYKLMGKGT